MASDLGLEERKLVEVLTTMSASTSSSSASPLLPSSLGRAEDLRATWRARAKAAAAADVVEWAEKLPQAFEGILERRPLHRLARRSRARPDAVGTEPGVKTITLQACTQLLKTTFIENVAGYFIHWTRVRSWWCSRKTTRPRPFRRTG
jgi:hypothetical protein